MLPSEPRGGEPEPTSSTDPRMNDVAAGSKLWWSIVAAIGFGFVVLGGTARELAENEARLGLAVGSDFGPMGRVYGGWAPDIWPVPLALGQATSLILGGWADNGVVRWPGMLCALVMGIVLARRAAGVLGGRAGLLAGLTTLSCLAMIDRSAVLGIDPISALGVVLALDRIIAKGPDFLAGLWTSLAFLSAGWPPVALVGLALVILKSKGSPITLKMVAPIVLSVLAWSVWTCRVVSVEAWLTALGMPLTQRFSWNFVIANVTLSWPWAPFALLLAWPSVRAGFSQGSARPWVIAWFQVVVVCSLVGTVVPGLASAARVPALLGVALIAAACLDRAWSELAFWPASARWTFSGLLVTVVLIWGLIVVLGFGYLSIAVTYYRALAIGLFMLVGPTFVIAVWSAWSGQGRRGILALFLVAVGLKLAYVGYFVPEWNYKAGQGAWGRAIGQWVPPRKTIYTSHIWQPDLAFATEHQFHQIVDPRSLQDQHDPLPRFVLLHEEEFKHWPEEALPLEKMAELEDEYGSKRVIARTKGPFSWRQATIDARKTVE